jgi:hypothetical protein
MWWAAVSAASSVADVLHQAEVQHLHHVVEPAALAQHHVRGLHVAVHEPDTVGLGQGGADLLQEVHDPCLRLRTLVLDQAVQRDPGQVLHRVIEDALFRAPVIVDGDRVGMAQRARELHLALEAGQRFRARDLGADELDRRGPPQEGVTGAVDRPHPALADLVLQRVLPQPVGARDVLLEPVDPS